MNKDGDAGFCVTFKQGFEAPHSFARVKLCVTVFFFFFRFFFHRDIVDACVRVRAYT